MDPQAALALGPLSLLMASLFYWGFRRSSKRYDTIRETPTIACRDLPGLGASTVEVVGLVRTESPLVSDLCRIACVAFRSSITEHWTTVETETDSDGKTRTVTRSHSETLYSNERRIAFQVHDSSGAATVEPEGAEIDLVDQSAGPAPPGSPAHGVWPRHGGSLHYAEAVLPIETTAYVLAGVSEQHVLVDPSTLGDPFIISHRSEESLLRRARWGRRIFGGLAAIALLGGLGMLGWWYDQQSPVAWRRMGTSDPVKHGPAH